jgi:hypothetical protein
MQRQTDFELSPLNQPLSLEFIYEEVSRLQLPPSAFVKRLDATEWDLASASDFARVIDMALHLEMIPLARSLAERGSRLHPGDEQLAKLARILQPPRVIDASVPPMPGLSLTMQWLKEHSAEYRDLWAAVKAGQLLGTAKTRKELVESLGDSVDAETLITHLV